MHLQARPWLTIVVGLSLPASLTGRLLAQDKKPAVKPQEQKAFDKKVYDVLRTVINTGADLYNRDGDRAGCYRLYQGSLLTIRPLLDRYPDLQKEIDTALADVDSQASVGERAHTLRKALDKIRSTLKPSTTGREPPPKPPEPKPPRTATTLWDRLGGEANVRKIVDDFVASGLKDPKVNFDRDGKYKLDEATLDDFKKRVVEFISQGSGGPLKYTGKSVKAIHQGMGITNAEFDAAVTHIQKALEKNGVQPADVRAVLLAIGGLRKDVVVEKK